MGKFKDYIKSLAIFLLFINTLKLSAQNQITYFGVDDGLPSSNVYSTFQDSKGYIWVSTEKGLARYDGYKFEVFTVKDGLPYNDVWGVQEDLQGRIWLLSYASHFTHYSYEDNKFHVIKNENKHSNNELIAFYHIDDKKEVWACSSINFIYYKLRNNEAKLFIKNDGHSPYAFPIFGYPLISRAAVKDSIRFSFTYSSITKFGRNISNFNLNYNIGLLYRDWREILFYASGNYNHIKLINGFKKDERIVFYKEIGLPDFNSIKSFIFYNSSELYMLCKNRLVVFDTSLNYKIITNYPVPFLSINNIQQDKDGNDWISTKDMGLVYIVKNNELANKKLIVFKSINNSITTIDGDKAGNIVCGLKNGELIYKGLDQLKAESYKFNVEEKPVRSIRILPNKAILVSWYTNPKLLEMKKGRLYENRSQNVSMLKLLDYIDTKKIDTYNAETILTTHYRKLILGNFSNNTYKILLMGNRYQTSIVDNYKQIWLASSSGLGKFLNDSTADNLVKLKKQFSILGKSILAMQCDKKNYIWCGTDGFGMYAFKENKPYIIKELTNEIINDISIDANENVWVSTNKGGYSIQIINAPKFEYKLMKYTIANGLPTNEVNCIFANDSFAYFGTQKGLGIIYLKEKRLVASVPPFYVKQILAGNDTIHDKNFTLPYNKSRLEIDYVCLSYNSKGNIIYFYKLEGIDTQWQTTDQLKIVYPFLPPDNYKLLIKAKDISEQYSRIETIVFTITPPFWQTWWFKLLVVFALILVVVAYVAYRIARIRRKEKEKTIVNKKLAELELQALQSQMNPHFIFNSLNAIQAYIFNQNEILANEYLTKFSRLMRLFLESSRKKYISLEDEINLITIYTEMELMRFKDKFKVEFRISANLNRSQEVPSMLIQPFIENAINHGLLYKNEKGILIVEFKQEADGLIVIIDDDGIGREAARKVKESSVKSYKSRAMEITQDRLATLKTIDEMNVNIEIVDKFENHTATGTKVIITIKSID